MKINLAGVLRLHTEEADRAFGTLCGPVPPEYTYSRPGRGGTDLTYLPHYIANRLLLEAFGPYWSWEVLETVQYGEHGGSGPSPAPKFVRATGVLTLYVQVGDRIIERRTTGVGAFDNTQKYNAAAADASAASMALSKSLVRAFGFGLRHYHSDKVQPSVAPETVAWARVGEYAERKGVAKADVIKAMKELGRTGTDLADPAIEQEAVTIINRLSSAAEPAGGPPFDTSAISAQLPPAAERPASELPSNQAPPEDFPFDLDKTPLPPEGPDPVVAAAKELGGEVVVPTGWREFFIFEIDKHESLVSGTQIGQILNMIFRTRPMPDENRWGEMDMALEDWIAADADPDKQKLVMDTYQGKVDHSDEDEIPF